jgi:hypothetical protein
LIEKFNFYDIYGYFLPGAAFLAILCIPFGLVKNWWPSSSWSSAVIASAFAYILGHLIQSVATNAIPSKIKSRTGKLRNPSELYLDQSNEELPQPFKEKIATLVETQFNLKVQIEREDDDAVDKVRSSAFFLARQTLIQGKAVNYAEQFQGMYVLMRGLVCVFAVAFAYWIGWAATSMIRNHVTVGATVLILAGSLLALLNISLVLLRDIPDPAKKPRIELGYAAVLLVAFLAIGYAFGIRFTPTHNQGALLVFLAASALIASLRAYGAYKFFSKQFAISVWRDYLAYNAAAMQVKSDSGNK